MWTPFGRKGFRDFIYCAETMGKINQIGDLEEIGLLTQISVVWSQRLILAPECAHVGGTQNKKDYIAVLDSLEKECRRRKTRKMHVHFSHIQYTDKGEKLQSDL